MKQTNLQIWLQWQPAFHRVRNYVQFLIYREKSTRASTAVSGSEDAPNGFDLIN